MAGQVCLELWANASTPRSYSFSFPFRKELCTPSCRPQPLSGLGTFWKAVGILLQDLNRRKSNFSAGLYAAGALKLFCFVQNHFWSWDQRWPKQRGSGYPESRNNLNVHQPLSGSISTFIVQQYKGVLVSSKKEWSKIHIMIVKKLENVLLS